MAGIGLLKNAHAPLLLPGLAYGLLPIELALDGFGELSLTAWLIIINVNGP